MCILVHLLVGFFLLKPIFCAEMQNQFSLKNWHNFLESSIRHHRISTHTHLYGCLLIYGTLWTLHLSGTKNGSFSKVHLHEEGFFKVVDMMISFRRPLKVCNAFITCRQVVLVIPNLIGLSPYFGSPAGSSEEIVFFFSFPFLVFLWLYVTGWASLGVKSDSRSW